MVKKILFLNILLSIGAFSQQKPVHNLISVPNPFTTTTTISFESEKEQGILLVVKNVLGKTVFSKAYYTPKGNRKIIFNRNDLKSGMYIYAIQTDKDVISKRFVIK